MPIEITMPALSPTMTEGNLVKWTKKEGDKVKSGDIIAEIETDKATMELEASNSGIMGKIIINEGAEGVKVNTLIALLLKDGEDKSVLESYTPKSAEAVAPSSSLNASNSSNSSKVEAPKQEEVRLEVSFTKALGEGRAIASPLAKRIAGENGLDIAQISGTGPNGRVVKADVLGFKPQVHVHAVGRRGDVLEPLSSVRKVIAKRLLESKTTVPHFYLTLDVQMDEVMDFRSKANKGLEATGVKLSVNDLIIKASALALRDFPKVNASFTEGGMLMYGNVDISVAVSTDNGLITPIVKNADGKSLSAISTEMKELAKKARENKLKPEEFQGGGFSISNLGMYGINSFSAIINPPQSAILAVGTTVKKPLFDAKTGGFKPADFMSLTLSADHRVVDGALGAEFLNKIKFYLENPIMLGI
jgi:pyruvate dehydrogenase E2 component (dihydrolipoamide acetyltransferase)